MLFFPYCKITFVSLKQYVILSTLYFYDAYKLPGFFSPKSTNYEHACVYDIQYYFFLNNIKNVVIPYEKLKYFQWYRGLTERKNINCMQIICIHSTRGTRLKGN